MVMVACEFALAEPDAGHANMIVFLSGLSGVGKTTTATAFIERYTQFKHVVASELIRRAGADPQALDQAQAETESAYFGPRIPTICHSLRNLHILFDGHMIIETRKGEHVIDDRVIDGLYVSHFVAIIDDPSRIYSTRYTVGRTPLSTEELKRLQELEVYTTRRQAERTGCPFIQIQSGAIESLATSLRLVN